MNNGTVENHWALRTAISENFLEQRRQGACFYKPAHGAML